jgi:hypothetical protein
MADYNYQIVFFVFRWWYLFGEVRDLIIKFGFIPQFQSRLTVMFVNFESVAISILVDGKTEFNAL